MRILFLMAFAFSLSHVYCQDEFYECPINKEQHFTNNANLIPKNKLSDSSLIFVKIDTGNMLVFHYKQDYDCSGDGHFRVLTSLYWAVPMNKTSFELIVSRKDSLEMPISYTTGSGYTLKYNYIMESAGGSIKGVLNNGIWQINGNLKMYLYNYSKEGNGIIEKNLVVEGDYGIWRQKRKYRRYNKFFDF